MRLLSFDTSTSCLSVALAQSGQVLAEAGLDGGLQGRPEGRPPAKADRQEAVSELIPTIDRLIKEVGWKKSDLQAIAVGVGPGGFTGVRVAVVTGRTLAQALKLPVVPINSLESASYGEPSAMGAAVFKEASKTHCFIAAYERLPWQGDFYDLKAVRSPACISLEDFEQEIVRPGAPAADGKVRFCGSGALARRLAELAGGSVLDLPAVNNVAAIQAKIAYVRLSLNASDGDIQNHLQQGKFSYRLVQPLYLRGASVTLKKGDVIERVERY